jgi:catechol 2,3-dioxygenase-like lactoylglutathione lyase family enzyme
MPARLSACVPILRMADARISLPFYVDSLGFTKQWEHQFEPGLPLFVSLIRDDVRIFLTEHPETAFGGLIYLYVDDVIALANELADRGVDIGDGPVEQPWDVRELFIRDPDGNSIRFGQVLTQAESP